jgi:hypothetical protein
MKKLFNYLFYKKKKEDITSRADTFKLTQEQTRIINQYYFDKYIFRAL